MKYAFTILLSILFSLSVIGQIRIKHRSLEKVEKMDYVQHNTDEPGCIDADEDGKIDEIILFEFGGVDPSASDAKKAEVIERLDNWIKKLAVYEDCPATHTIIIKLAEGTFLKAADGFEVYSKKYYRSGYSLAAKRFKDRYTEQLESLLGDKRIILTDWNW